MRDLQEWGARPTTFVGVALLFGCAAEPPERAGTFEMLFSQVGAVELEEHPDDPIIGVPFVSSRPGGGFIVADEQAHKVRLFDGAGRVDRQLGGLGDGPEDLRGPSGAVELADGSVWVAQRANRTYKVFSPGRDPVLGQLPGNYGVWAGSLGDRVVMGMGSRAERFAILSPEPGGGVVEPAKSFGVVHPMVNDTPFWIFFAAERATVLGNEVVINTSFFPTLRVFDSQGDSVRTFGQPPPSWIPASAPPVDNASDPGAAQQITEWSRSFSIVTGLATVADSLIVVQHGRFDPGDDDPYRVRPERIDVYDRIGTKLFEDVPLDLPIIGGGRQLIVLVAQPPAPWTLGLFELKE